MQTNHDDDFYSPNRRETLLTLAISGLTPNLLAIAAR